MVAAVLDRFPRSILVGVATVWLIASLIMYFALKLWTEDRFEAEFAAVADARTALLAKVVEQAMEDVHGLSGFIQAHGSAQATAFERYVQPEVEEKRGDVLYAWIARVALADRPDFELDAEAEGLRGYAILDDRNGAPEPAPARPEYLVVRLLSPLLGHRQSLGLDLGVRPECLSTLQAARDSGEIRVIDTTPIILGGPGLALFAPVYAGGVAPGSVAERRRALLGFAYGALPGDALRRQSRISNHPFHAYLRVRDAQGKTLFDEAAPADAALPSLSRDLPVGDGQWRLTYTASEELLSHRPAWMPWSALALGLLLTAAYTLLTRQFIEQTRSARERSRELALHEARTRAILRTMQDGVVQIDSRGAMLAVNEAVTAMFGYEEDELLGRNVTMLMPAPYRDHHDGYLLNYGETRRACVIGSRREVEALRKDGTRFPIDIKVNEMVDDSGSTFIGILRDISDQKDATHLLELALADAESAVAAKGAFLANMSHEIRTPINAILGFVHLCLRQAMPARVHDYVDKTRQAAESLLGIVNDILDFSKIEAGKLELEQVEFSLDEVLVWIGTLFGLKARDKGLEFTAGALPGVPDRLLGDPKRLSQVLSNLVGNAVKFTERGEVGLTVEAVAANPEGVVLEFSVSDTGIGLSGEQQDRLFSPFTQADSSTTRRFGGTGLGLAICKQLIERMGGEIHVDSEPGRGSRFVFSARFGLAAEAPVERPETALSGKRILVVDDNLVMRTYLMRNLEAFGCRAEAVDSGAKALARLREQPAVDAILLDGPLPDPDGLAAVGANAPIVLLTGFDAEIARAQAGEDGIRAVLTKPVSRSMLLDTLSGVLFGQGFIARPQSAGQAPAPNLAGSRVLLVDDNDFNRQVGRELVELTGATVATAEDGREALDRVEAADFDLVLMDIQMPVLDGYDASRAIRERHPDLPILALTAHALAEERNRCLAAGMNAVLNKPIVPAELFAALARWLPVSESFAEAEPTATLDPDVMMATANGDAEFYRRILGMFRASPVIDMAALKTALAEGDLAKARRQAHSLKGMAGSIGAKSLQTAAGGLERALAGGAAADGELAEVEARLADVLAAIEQA